MYSLTLPTYAKIHPLEDDTIIFFQAKMIHMDCPKKDRTPTPTLAAVRLAASAASPSARGKTASSTLRWVRFHSGINRPLFYRVATHICAFNHTFHSSAA